MKRKNVPLDNNGKNPKEISSSSHRQIETIVTCKKKVSTQYKENCDQVIVFSLVSIQLPDHNLSFDSYHNFTIGKPNSEAKEIIVSQIKSKIFIIYRKNEDTKKTI